VFFFTRKGNMDLLIFVKEMEKWVGFFRWPLFTGWIAH
jgi:hypothetical protein